MANDDFRFVYTEKVPLTNEQKDELASRITRKIGEKVFTIQDVKDGYVIRGKYGVEIGRVDYNFQRGCYEEFKYRPRSIEEISARDMAQKHNKGDNKSVMKRSRSRKFALQKGKSIGKRLGAGALMAVLLFGGALAIKTKAAGPNYKIPSYNMEQVNTVANANDLILYSWANYAMNEVVYGSNNNNYEYSHTVAEDLKNSYYNPLMLQYYNYTDQIESGLPADVIGKLKDSYHNEFRNLCYIFDEALEGSFFDYATFDESPYADAIVFDNNGNRVVENGLYGESYDTNGNLIIPSGNVGYIVYIKAEDVPGHDYSITNLPTDARFINGETYVSDEHLDDFQNANNRVK